MKSSAQSSAPTTKVGGSKIDISAPTNFKHVNQFIGNGYQSKLDIFLEKAGVTNEHRKNRDTMVFIEDFILTNKVFEGALIEEKHKEECHKPDNV